MTLEEYEALVQAYSDASESVLSAKEKVREAQAHLQYLEDQKRKAWIALKDAERPVANQDSKAIREVMKDLNKFYNRAGRRG